METGPIFLKKDTASTKNPKQIKKVFSLFIHLDILKLNRQVSEE